MSIPYNLELMLYILHFLCLWQIALSGLYAQNCLNKYQDVLNEELTNIFNILTPGR